VREKRGKEGLSNDVILRRELKNLDSDRFRMGNKGVRRKG
jgi:hypothetical protein